MNKYRFAFDMGTNSIGYAVVKLDDEGKTLKEGDDALVDLGVRIFTDGRESTQKKSVPLNQARREARHVRRQRDRRIMRKEEILRLNAKYGLYDPQQGTDKEAEKLNPYAIRAKALDTQLTPAELGRVFFHMGIRRGFKSSRKESKDEKENKTTDKIAELKARLSQSGLRTLGEYFYKELQNNPQQPIRFKDGLNKDAKVFPDWQMLEDEFMLVKEKQAPYFPQLPWGEFKDVIFYRRDLKEQKRGFCLYEDNEPRAYKLQPSSQKVRLWQDIINIKFIPDALGVEAVDLDSKEKIALFKEMDEGSNKTQSWKPIIKKYFKGQTGSINLDRTTKTGLEGNLTAVEMRKSECFGDMWDTLPLADQDKIVELIIELNSYELEKTEKAIDAMLAKLILSDDQKTAIKGHKLFSSTASNQTSRLSALAQRKFCEVYAQKQLRYDKVAEELYGEKQYEQRECLPYYGVLLSKHCTGQKMYDSEIDKDKNPEDYYGTIPNPTVHIALNQMRVVVNHLISKYGKPHTISLELARDVKNNKKQKKEIDTQNKANKAKRDEAKAKIDGAKHPVNHETITRIQIFDIQEHDGVGVECPYCGRGFNMSEALAGHDIQVDHILPYSRFLNDRIWNKVLSCRSCNREKGGRTPYEWKAGDPVALEEMANRIAHYPPRTRDLFGKNIPKDVEEASFSDRQLNDTRYICRATMEYIGHLGLAGGIAVNTGAFTAQFRRAYEFNNLLGVDDRKDRDDHRHHAIDAVIVALIDRSCFARLIRAAKSLGNDQQALSEDDKRKMERDPFKMAIKKAGLETPPFSRGRVKELLEQMLPTVKPQQKISGCFFKDTAMGRIKKPVITDALDLTEDDIPNILSFEIQERVESLSDEHGGNFKKMRAALKDEYPSMYVYKEYWVTRKPLDSLKEGNLEVHTSKGKHTGPVDDKLRKILKDEVDNGYDLTTFLKKYSNETGTKRIRYIVAPYIEKNQNPYNLGTQAQPRGYFLDEYAYADIWHIPAHTDRSGKKVKEKYEGIFVSRPDAHKINERKIRKTKPHPAAKKLMRLYKQDVICCTPKEESGEKVYYRVKGLNESHSGLDICPIHKTCDKKQNLKAVNALFSENTVHKVSQRLQSK